MSSTPGTLLCPYQILTTTGAGGGDRKSSLFQSTYFARMPDVDKFSSCISITASGVLLHAHAWLDVRPGGAERRQYADGPGSHYKTDRFQQAAHAGWEHAQ